MDISNFRYPKLTDEQYNQGCKLGITTLVDTSCTGKHAFMEDFAVGKTDVATGLFLGSVSKGGCILIVGGGNYENGRGRARL